MKIMIKLGEEDFNRNGELGGVGFLVEVRLTTKGLFKSFSRRELKEELNTRVEKFAAFYYVNQSFIM